MSRVISLSLKHLASVLPLQGSAITASMDWFRDISDFCLFLLGKAQIHIDHREDSYHVQALTILLVVSPVHTTFV